jgi:type I restriction enzyme, S subunit
MALGAILHYQPNQLEKIALRVGDIVFARTGGTVGKSFIISAVPEAAVFASYLIRLTSHSGVNPKFLYYFFQSLSYWEQIGLKKGGLQGNVNATTLASLEVPVAPTNEQTRIVAKIEELFSELDKGTESLTTAREQLKSYLQALLKHAFEGKLTADWRDENPEKLESTAALISRLRAEREGRYAEAYQNWQQAVAEWCARCEVGQRPRKPEPPDVRGRPDISDAFVARRPKIWPWLRLGDISDVSGGLTKNPKRNAMPIKMKYLRVANI